MKTCKNADCCENMAHTMELKICRECKKVINGWNCALCDDCSKENKQCGHCLSSLNGDT